MLFSMLPAGVRAEDATVAGSMAAFHGAASPDTRPRISIPSISTKEHVINPIIKNSFTNTPAVVEVITGRISSEKQIDSYRFTPSITGRHRFEMSGLYRSTVSIFVFDAEGRTVGSSWVREIGREILWVSATAVE
jgi:hypothetical protein